MAGNCGGQTRTADTGGHLSTLSSVVAVAVGVGVAATADAAAGAGVCLPTTSVATVATTASRTHYASFK